MEPCLTEEEPPYQTEWMDLTHPGDLPDEYEADPIGDLQDYIAMMSSAVGNIWASIKPIVYSTARGYGKTLLVYAHTFGIEYDEVVEVDAHDHTPFRRPKEHCPDRRIPRQGSHGPYEGMGYGRNGRKMY